MYSEKKKKKERGDLSQEISHNLLVQWLPNKIMTTQFLVTIVHIQEEPMKTTKC